MLPDVVTAALVVNGEARASQVSADQRRIPPYWLSMRSRTSPLSHEAAARHAVDPANAILNYAYAVLEGHTRQALSVNGLDLACGFLHVDRQGRDALVYNLYDLMELARPAVDDRVLSFLQATTFQAGNFTRVSDGSCRPPPSWRGHWLRHVPCHSNG
jgi:hypothetical protein